MLEEKVYKLSIEKVLECIKTSRHGLEKTEAENRLFENGLNQITERKKKHIIIKFFEQFKNIMIIILIIAAIISFVIAKYENKSITESIIIFAVVILNAILGLYQEEKAEKSIENLKKLSVPYIKVKRDGCIESIKTEELVVGDIVIIESGNFVPADMRIIQNNSLRVEEAVLTGESLPVDKTSDEILKDVALADRTNMLYSGSSVVYGTGEAVVVAIGMDTELGKIATSLTNIKESLTPLQKKLAEVSKTISIIVVIIGITMVIFGMLQNFSFMEIFMLSVSLCVAAIPEGLPTSITVILSIGITKMAKRNSIIRKLSSVETLGSTEIICSDKTGTLTENKMKVKEIYFNDKRYELSEIKENINKNDTYELFIKTMLLCNNTKMSEKGEYLGEATEIALSVFAENFATKKNIGDAFLDRISELPFDSTRKMMSTIYFEQNNYNIYVKGAIESILDRCKYIHIDGQIKEMSSDLYKRILAESIEMSKRALRVLAFAYKKENDKPNNLTSEEIERDLVFVGLVGMIDQPRAEVKDAVKKCFSAGIIPIMITGDNIDTAKVIAEDIGILGKKHIAITGMELDKMTDEEFIKRIEKIRVYARVSPENKVRIVSIWKRLGKTVAMTGDGVNDAPALKAADIGIGMGITGTEISKNVSSMVLADDNFATIVVAVEEGRKIYNNIQNVIVYLLASNIAEIIIVFFAMMFNSIILNPIQLLWVNLVTDTIPAIALGFEKSDSNIMKQKPRPANEKLFNKQLTSRIVIPAILKSTFILLIYFLINNSIYYSHQEAMTVAFITLVFAELLFAFVVRNDKKTILNMGIFTNLKLIIGILFTLLLQIIVIFSPAINKIFNIVRLDAKLYVVAIFTAIVFMIISDLSKLISPKEHIKD